MPKPLMGTCPPPPQPPNQPAPNATQAPQRSRRTPSCRCGKPVEVDSWLPDGSTRGYCLECHLAGFAKIEAAMIAQRELERESCLFVRRTLGRFLLAIAAVWALGWVGGSDHPSEAGEPPLWHWALIAPLAALGALLTRPSTTPNHPSNPLGHSTRKTNHE